MTVQEALAYLNNYGWSSTRLGLERTRELLERLGDPQKDLRFIHVAGTNGKGSTCAMLERILREAGFCTGFYPSPFLQDFRERIQVNGEYISEARLAAITARVAAQADVMEDHPSHFELITAVGMLYFREMHCDYVVLEVGMGGELDSTNVIDPPEVAVITSIGLDHTEYLGSTLEEIARTKCGILKRGSSAVSYRNTPEVMAVIRETCRDRMIPLYEAPPVESDARDGEDVLEPLGHGLDGQRFRYRGREYRLPLLGRHQLRNAATVLKTVEALRDRGVILPDEAVERGLALTEWPARFEVLSREPLLILDGGHNPQCAEALVENIREYLADESGRAEVTFLFGMLADKDYRRTLELLLPYGTAYVCITPDNPRALPAEELAELIRSEQPGRPVLSAEEIPDASAAALEFGRPVIAFGSLYSAGHIRTEAA
ncbi:MAG: bifunctional folylpolyglutamate synthase/dihydrofolate synthase, partial [Oscillospiraceae bacterium]|nr:bifunctional folylpolyglutamate synthase/dihydrofolate synthase [Oscillospiraceae bacterium]